jgi:hypothetical protein
MKSITETPTEPSDYAALSAVYGTLLAGLALAAHRQRLARQPLTGPELAATGAATFALAKLVAKEKVETWLRIPFVEEENGTRNPRGSGLRYAIGELLTCTRCAGAWSALGVVGLRIASPDAGRAVTTVLAASAANDWLQSGFTWLCGQANRASE